MKFIKLSTLFLASMVLAAPSYATTIEEVLPWDMESSKASVFYKNDSSENTRLLSTSISHSKDGKQRLYFEVDYDFTTIITPSVSREESSGSIAMRLYFDSRTVSTPSSTIMIFNGQAIKMLGFTKKYSDTNNTYYSYTPETIVGHNYLVNLFKKSASPIEVDFQGDKIYIPVIGFTKIWNNRGGNAI